MYYTNIIKYPTSVFQKIKKYALVILIMLFYLVLLNACKTCKCPAYSERVSGSDCEQEKQTL
jgi:hypothetical protein